MINFIFYSLRNLFIINICGANFILRKIPYIGFVFYPLAILGLHNIKKTKGARLKNTLLKLGPTFIKLGQLLSTRPDLVGESLARDLAALQDKLPPFSFHQVQKILMKELAGDIGECFNEITTYSYNAASISQVHQAKTKDGKIVALKILRPGIKKRFLREIRFLYVIASLLDYFNRLKRLKLKKVVELLKRTVEQELDLRLEAAAADQLRDNLKHDNNIYIPKILWEFTSQKILCMEWVKGYKINELDKIKQAKIDLKQVAENLINCYFVQAYQYGFFHADMHPGNIIIMADGKIAFVDFGIMGKLSYNDRIYVTQIIYGFIKRDYDYIAKLHHMAGYIPKNTNLKEFSLACRSIGEPIFGLPSNKISLAKMLAHLFQVTEQYGMETQPQLLLLQKTLVIIEGVGYSLDSNLNMWQLGEPWLRDWAKKNLNIENKITHNLSEFCATIHAIPQIIHNIKNISDDLVNKKQQGKKHRKIRGLYLIIGVLIGCVTTMILRHCC
mgnify:CR=1 FL=1